MPELPEVETTLRAIHPVLAGNTIIKVEVLRPNMVITPGFAARMKNRDVRSVKRHGKYLVIHLNGDDRLVLHLRMSGRLGLRKSSDPPLKHERIRFVLESGDILVFNDPRTLGKAGVLKIPELEKALKHLGPDAMEIDAAELRNRLSKRRIPIKTALMDQRIIAGIGNIYAQEACFIAGIDPRRPASSLSPKELAKLFHAVRQTLNQGIKNMGTSFSDFAGLTGKPGKNRHALLVYGRKGLPCKTCGRPLEMIRQAQRGTVFCPRCQKNDV